MTFAGFLVIVSVASGAFYLSYSWRARRVTSERLAGMIRHDALQEAPALVPHRRTSFPRRYRYLAPVVAVATAAVLWAVTSLPLEVDVSIGLLFGVLASLLEAHNAEQQEALIEAQLAGAIDLMVSSIRAGAGLLAAFESTLQEAEHPLRPYFQDVAGRIRLGDDPRSAVGDLQTRVPLETFQLFATSLAIHWEVGGSLATTLSTVGRTIRDRIELSRRVRAQGVESHASVAVILAITYILAFLMWRTNPDRLEAFVRTGIGTMLVAFAIGLQAVGLVWMSRLSRSKF